MKVEKIMIDEKEIEYISKMEEDLIESVFEKEVDDSPTVDLTSELKDLSKTMEFNVGDYDE